MAFEVSGGGLKTRANRPMARQRTNPDFLNGVPELLILKLLEAESLHGYEIVRRIRVLSGRTLEFGEGCIYPILHRLEAEGMLRSRREQVGGRLRVVYRLTAKGGRRLKETASQWQRVVAAIGKIMEGSGDAGQIGMA